jgi:hypothetical protein
MRAGSAVVVALIVGVVACGGGEPARFPSRAAGCDVKLFHENPDVPTENIGPVQARCADDVAEADCLRTLEDAVCKLGGDVVWGVGDPEHKAGRNRFYGRAAHTKVR